MKQQPVPPAVADSLLGLRDLFEDVGDRDIDVENLCQRPTAGRDYGPVPPHRRLFQRGAFRTGTASPTTTTYAIIAVYCWRTGFFGPRDGTR